MIDPYDVTQEATMTKTYARCKDCGQSVCTTSGMTPEARNWLMRWVLLDCPERVATDMFVTVPEDVVGYFYRRAAGGRWPGIGGAIFGGLIWTELPDKRRYHFSWQPDPIPTQCGTNAQIYEVGVAFRPTAQRNVRYHGRDFGHARAIARECCGVPANAQKRQ